MPIAIYHLSIKVISRGKGKSAVAAAAYRAGEQIYCEHDGRLNDYTRKGGIEHTEILLPANAPPGYADRAVLWNAVEKIEKAKNSQLAREIELALPVELTKEENISLVREYVKHNFVDKGMCADICIHDKNDGNPHAHIMLTMRPFEQSGEWGAKSKKEYILDDNGKRIALASGEYKSRKIPAVDWNEQTKAEDWRGAWAECCNDYLERGNHTDRIDHRSYERQGIEQIPTVHLGVAASQMERRGIRTERGDINREIEVSNQKLRQLKARLAKLQSWLFEEMQNTEPPTLADVISNTLTRREQTGERSRYGSINSLKAAAGIFNFLQANGIVDMAGLNEKVSAMQDKQFAIRDELVKVERRAATLDEHLKHSANYKTYRGYKAQYDKLYAEHTAIRKARGFLSERKAQKALDKANEYYENHRMEITLCQAAERYLKDVLQGHFDPAKLPPITKWKAEREKLTADRNRLNRQYQELKTDTATVEKIKRNVDDIMREDTRIPQRKRTYDMER